MALPKSKVICFLQYKSNPNALDSFQRRAKHSKQRGGDSERSFSLNSLKGCLRAILIFSGLLHTLTEATPLLSWQMGLFGFDEYIYDRHLLGTMSKRIVHL